MGQIARRGAVEEGPMKVAPVSHGGGPLPARLTHYASALAAGNFAVRPALTFVGLDHSVRATSSASSGLFSVQPMSASARSISRPCMTSVIPASCDTASVVLALLA